MYQNLEHSGYFLAKIGIRDKSILIFVAWGVLTLFKNSKIYCYRHISMEALFEFYISIRALKSLIFNTGNDLKEII